MTPKPPTLPEELSPILATSHLAGTPLQWMSAGDMPQPYRGLLEHDQDMTSMLEAHHGEKLHLEVLKSIKDGDVYLREVVLHLSDGAPVEYGIIEILLDSYPEDLHPLILSGEIPLGQILNDYGPAYVSSPQGFLHVPTEKLSDLFPSSSGGEILYGRYNHLIRADDSRPLARIIEILPTTS